MIGSLYLHEMNILVPDNKLLEMCRSKKIAVRELGESVGKKLIQRVSELMAADSMDDFRTAHASGVLICTAPPPPTFQVHIQDSLNLLLRPVDRTLFNESTQIMDWTLVTDIELLKIAR